MTIRTKTVHPLLEMKALQLLAGLAALYVAGGARADVACGQTVSASGAVINLVADLDCSGYDGTALTVSGSNITISGGGCYGVLGRNCHILSSGYNTFPGLSVTGSDNTIESIDLSGTGTGTGLYVNGANNLIQNVTADNLDYGVSSDDASGSTFDTVSATNDTQAGMSLAAPNGGLTIVHSDVSNNVGAGLILDDVSGAIANSPVTIGTDNVFTGSTIAIQGQGVTGVTFSGLTLDNPTAIYISQGSDGNTFQHLNVTGTGSGYGLYINGENNLFQDITADHHDYGLYSDDATGDTFDTVRARNNNYNGVDLEGANGGLTIVNSDLGLNVGAGLVLNNVNGTIVNSPVTIGSDNTFTGSGFAIAGTGVTGVTFSGLTLDNVFAIFIQGDGNTFQHLDLSGDSSGNGTGLYVDGANLIQNVTADHRDYGLYSDDASGSTFDTCTANHSNFSGMWLGAPSGGLRVVNSALSDNYFNGLHISNGSGSAENSVANCTLTGNGTGINADGATSFSRVIIDGAGTGACLYQDSGGGTVASSTFYNCGPAASFLGDGTTLTFDSSIVYPTGAIGTGTLTATYSDLPAGWATNVGSGPGNIFGQDPLFTNSAGEDFSLLSANSPAVNSGDPALTAPAPGTGSTIDMGAIESAFFSPPPTIFTVTGGGSYCAGGSGVLVGLNGSEAGVSYQLLRDGASFANAADGTGAALSLGFETVPGTYTIVATNTTTGSTATMNGSVAVTVNPLPTVYAVTGGGGYCGGGTGVHVGLSGSSLGSKYQLWRNGALVASGVDGSGFPLDFGLETTSGSYTVVATNTATGCTAAMSGSATVTVNPLPTVYAVTGGGGYCGGGTGVHVGLSGSSLGSKYQLWRNGALVASGVDGSGFPLDFGLETTSGSYTVVATNTATGCTAAMSGSATVTVNPLPTVFTVTGGGTAAAGGSGVPVGLSGSTLGVNYQLRLNGSPIPPVTGGSGFPLSFGHETAAGTYTVSATNTATGCTAAMSGSAAICVPLAVCSRGDSCGTIPDGCGGSIHCGTLPNGACGAGLTCGGSGTPNTCGCQTFAQRNAKGPTLKGDQKGCSGAQFAPGTIINGNLNVAANQSCVLDGVTISGSVQIAKGASITVTSAVINGNLQTKDSNDVLVDACTSIFGNVQLQDSSGGVGLAGYVGGNVQIQDDEGSLAGGNWICDATIDGDLQVKQSAANSPFDIGGAPTCSVGNTIGGNIDIEQNLAPVTLNNSSAGEWITVQNNGAAVTVEHDRAVGNIGINQNGPATINYDTAGSASVKSNFQVTANGATILTNDYAGGQLQCQKNASLTAASNTALKGNQGCY